MMCSYNTLNGIPACSNKYLLQDIARDHWNWTDRNQYITTDCNAVKDIYANVSARNPPFSTSVDVLTSNTQHNYTDTLAEATAISLIEGTDQICVVGNVNVSDQAGAYSQGLLTEDIIDLALVRQYQGLISAGYFDQTSPYRNYSWADVNTPEAQALALKAAQMSIVMLKNDGTLPMSVTGKKVALIGFWANGTNVLQGDYSGPAPYIHNPVYAAQQLGLDYVYANGPKSGVSNTSITDPAMEAAESADVVLYFGGIDTSIEVEGLDRINVTWPTAQVEFIQQLAALGKPLVISQLGTQVDDTAWLESSAVNAILWAGYPSQSGGTALLDIITGAIAPAGRLPITQYPDDYVNQVTAVDQSLRPSNSSPGRTYKWYDGAVLPFGYGLHYTEFSAKISAVSPQTYSGRHHGWDKPSHHHGGPSYDISAFKDGCDAAYPDLETALTINIKVENKGKVTSDFSALVFVAGQHGPKPYPIKELAGYKRFFAVEGGRSQKAQIPITLGSLARRDVKGRLVLYPGQYSLLLDVPMQATYEFTLEGKPWVLDDFPQPPEAGTNGCGYCTPQTNLTSPPSGQ
jgi:beta-D-xylosidase 4